MNPSASVNQAHLYFSMPDDNRQKKHQNGISWLALISKALQTAPVILSTPQRLPRGPARQCGASRNIYWNTWPSLRPGFGWGMMCFSQGNLALLSLVADVRLSKYRPIKFGNWFHEMYDIILLFPFWNVWNCSSLLKKMRQSFSLCHHRNLTTNKNETFSILLTYLSSI